MLCLCIYEGKTQIKIDTIDFKTAVDRILADYPSKFQNIKAVDTCPTFCQLDFYIPGSYYPFCEISRSYTKELNFELKEILLVALQNNFGKVSVVEENCAIKGEKKLRIEN